MNANTAFIGPILPALLLGCASPKEKATPGSEGAPSIAWHVGQGTDLEEHVHEGVQTSDGGYIAIGHTSESGSSKTDVLTIKVDSGGSLEWQRIYGAAGGWDVGIAVIEVEDGFVAAGGLDVSGTQKPALIKHNPSGVEMWTKTFDLSGVGMIRGIAALSDGGLVVTGFYGGEESGFVFISDESTGFVAKLNDNGDVIWREDINGPQGTKIRETSDGGFAVLSTVWVDEGGIDVQNAAIIKLNSSGELEWRQTYGGGNNQAFDFDLAPTGEFLIAGHTTGFGAANWDCIMTKVDSDGTLIWQQVFGQPREYDAKYIHDECYGIRVDSDGGYVMAGGTGNETAGYSDGGHPAGSASEWKAYVVKTDADGEVLWQQVYGDGADNGHNAAEFLTLSDDGGYLLLNDSDSIGEMEPNNFGFMKLAAEP